MLLRKTVVIVFGVMSSIVLINLLIESFIMQELLDLDHQVYLFVYLLLFITFIFLATKLKIMQKRIEIEQDLFSQRKTYENR